MSKPLSVAVAIVFGGSVTVPALARDNSVPAVEALAKWSSNAGPVEYVTPDVIRSRLLMTQEAAVAAGRRPAPALVPAGKSMTIEEIRAFVVKQGRVAGK